MFLYQKCASQKKQNDNHCAVAVTKTIFLNIIKGLLAGSGKKIKFHGVFRDKPVVKMADFVGNSRIFRSNFAEK